MLATRSFAQVVQGSPIPRIAAAPRLACPRSVSRPVVVQSKTRRTPEPSKQSTKGNDKPWWQRPDWMDASNWRKPEAAGDIYTKVPTPSGGSFYRLNMYQVPTTSTRFGIPIPLFRAIFGEPTTQAVVEIRCEEDGKEVLKAGQAVLSFNPNSISRRSVTIAREYIAIDDLAGRAVLGYVHDPPATPGGVPRLTVVLRTVPTEQQQLVSTVSRTQVVVSIRREGGKTVFTTANPQPIFAARNARGITVPKPILEELFVKRGLVKLEMPLDTAGNPMRQVEPVPVKVRLEGTTIKQPGQILNTTLHVYFNKATGGFHRAILTGLAAQTNGLPNKIISCWTFSQADEVLTLTIEDPNTGA